jgi:hypothetical protein
MSRKKGNTKGRIGMTILGNMFGNKLQVKVMTLTLKHYLFIH